MSQNFSGFDGDRSAVRPPPHLPSSAPPASPASPLPPPMQLKPTQPADPFTILTLECNILTLECNILTLECNRASIYPPAAALVAAATPFPRLRMKWQGEAVVAVE
jgi:hypothetical protein